MDHDTKVTYSVIATLIVLLGGLAYYIQHTVTLPQVQVETGQQATSSAQASSVSVEKKTITETPSIKSITSKNSNSTSTMELPEKFTQAVITTNKGVIEITFTSSTPETVKNFAKLAIDGFYDGTRFHRVIRDFMIQGGDPLSKDIANKNIWGTGGPGYTFKDETSSSDVFAQGTVAMANSGPNTNGSQFFIVTAVAGTPWLVGKHTVFAHVTKGFDVVLHIQDLQTDGRDQPTQDVIVEKIDVK
jgi:cyclophilin family peptidyl-prolyl cis-trans isomerase